MGAGNKWLSGVLTLVGLFSAVIVVAEWLEPGVLPDWIVLLATALVLVVLLYLLIVGLVFIILLLWMKQKGAL
jgi:hypothetical protein